MTINTILPCLSIDKVFLFGPLILTNNWSFRTNILNISLDRNFPHVYDIVMGICSVSREGPAHGFLSVYPPVFLPLFHTGILKKYADYKKIDVFFSAGLISGELSPSLFPVNFKTWLEQVLVLQEFHQKPLMKWISYQVSLLFLSKNIYK